METFTSIGALVLPFILGLLAGDISRVRTFDRLVEAWRKMDPGPAKDRLQAQVDKSATRLADHLELKTPRRWVAGLMIWLVAFTGLQIFVGARLEDISAMNVVALMAQQTQRVATNLGVSFDRMLAVWVVFGMLAATAYLLGVDLGTRLAHGWKSFEAWNRPEDEKAASN